MMHAATTALDDSGVPEPTENGRLGPDALARVVETQRTARARLVMAIGLWGVYVVAMPIFWARVGPAALWLVPTAGVFVMSQLGYYRHELWHGYFPGISNPDWFAFVSYLMFSDPQVYRLAHPTHHKYVHTTGDLEFFCEGWATRPWRRRAQMAIELLLGNMAWEVTTLIRLRRAGRATARAGQVALIKRLALLLGLMGITRLIQPGCEASFLACYAATLWMGSVVTRHNQWIEHLGLLSDGDLAQRNMLTRNLRSDTLGGWLFNWINHDDARVHVFHHTEPGIDSRRLGGIELPVGAQTVTLGQYARILVEHVLTL